MCDACRTLNNLCILNLHIECATFSFFDEIVSLLLSLERNSCKMQYMEKDGNPVFALISNKHVRTDACKYKLKCFEL